MLILLISMVFLAVLQKWGIKPISEAPLVSALLTTFSTLFGVIVRDTLRRVGVSLGRHCRAMPWNLTWGVLVIVVGVLVVLVVIGSLTVVRTWPL